MPMEGLDFGIGPREVFPPMCVQGWEGEGISVLLFKKNHLNVLVHPPSQFIPSSALSSVSGSQQI